MQTPSVSLFTRRRTLYQISSIIAGVGAADGISAQAEDKKGRLMAYVGTYTSPLKNMRATQVDLPPGNGRGIHIFEVNRATGGLSPAGVYEMGTSPSCLVLSPDKKRLYTGNETERVGLDESGTVSAFAIQQDGSLMLLNSVSSGGKGPAHLSVHPSGKYVLVANYFGGSVAVLPINEDGRLGEASDLKKDIGKVGPTKATNAPPGSYAISGHDQTHAHMVEADPSGRFVIHVDLGLDQIYVWKFNEQKGKLEPAGSHVVSIPAGDGPRHFAFHPNKRWIYSVQEEGSTVILFDFNAETGELTSRQTISTLPPRYAGSNFCSEIAISASGRFVYVGNRLHDSIGIFGVGKDGALSYINEEWTRGDYPRSFSFDPAERFLYCCNQRADHITIFQVERNGKLIFTGDFVPVGNPSQIIFKEFQ